MQNRHRNKLHPEKLEWRAVDETRVELRDVRLPFHAVEDVREAALDGGHSVRRRVYRDLALLAEVEWPDVVEPHDVVRVRVRKDDAVEVIDVGPQRLEAK